jgi:membrane associated rhomboid family serine protease
VPLLVLVLVLANVLAWALPGGRLPLGPMLLDAASLALLGPSVESRLGHLPTAALVLAGAAAGLAVGALAQDSAAAGWASGGATAAVLLGYLLLFPRARVLSLVPAPFVVTIVEVPAVLLLGAWTGAQLYLGLSA